MNNHFKSWWLHIAFTLGGAILGIVIYSVISHLIQGRILVSDMISSAIYTSIAGLIVSGVAMSARDSG